MELKIFIYLHDPIGIFEIESLSMLLYVTLECFRVLLVQLTGTITVKARSVMGTKIFSLHSLDENETESANENDQDILR